MYINDYSYGIYDTECCNYRYMFTCPNDTTARRQFVGYMIGSSDLFNEVLELHRLNKLGKDLGDVTIDFHVVCDSKDLLDDVKRYRGQYTNKRE